MYSLNSASVDVHGSNAVLFDGFDKGVDRWGWNVRLELVLESKLEQSRRLGERIGKRSHACLTDIALPFDVTSEQRDHDRKCARHICK